tara:strand:- start:2131 stop:5421 length:3291 start_codon:yes stop_codon:yes gene_type:complete
MATVEPTLDELLARGVESVSQTPLDNNPNKTYVDILRPDELKVAALKSIPYIRDRFIEAEGADVINKQINDFNQFVVPKITTYDRAPFEYEDSDYFSGYARQLEDYEKNFDTYKQRRQIQYVRGNYPESVQEPRPPFKPFGFDASKEIADLGWNPFNELDFPGIRNFRNQLARGAPPNLMFSDLNYAKENMDGGRFAESLPGEFIPADPSNPSKGSIYIEEGKEPQIFDSPTVRPLDVLEFAQQEVPTIATEVAFGLKGLKHFDAFLRKSDIAFLEDNPITRKFFDSVSSNVFLAGGAAGARFVQRLIGAANGAHNRSVEDMMEETGWTFLLAYGGNQTIDLFLNGLPKLYRAIMGKDLGAEQVKAIKEAIERKRASKSGETTTTISGRQEDVTLLDIDEAVAQLSKEIGEKLSYKPTLAAASKDNVIADIEAMLLQGANNPAYKEFYDEAMKGNEEVIQKLFGNLFDNLDPNVTGRTISKELLNLMGRKKKDFINNSEQSIQNLILQVDNIKTTGKETPIFEKVLDNKTASDLYPKLTSRINEISRTYKDNINTIVDDALINSGIADLVFTSRPIRKQILNFKNAAEGTTGTLASPGKGQIRKLYKETFSEEAIERLTKYSEGDLTLPEINQLRIDINSIRTGIDPSKSAGDLRAFNLTSDLQTSIENQMYKTIRSNLPKKEAQDLIDLFDAQRMVYDTANKQVIKDMAKQEPEGVINYLLSTGSKNKPLINTKANDFMNFLKETGSVPEIRAIQNGLINHIRKNFLDPSAGTPNVLAKNYKEFIEQNQATLETVFGKELFEKGFPKTGKAFNETIIEPLEKLNRKYRLLEQKYGEGDPFNIVSKILDSSPQAKMSGELIDDLDFLDDLLSMATPAEREILESQIKDASKKYLFTRMQTDGLFDPRKLNQLFNEGFAPAGYVGDDLSFKGVYRRLLGDETDSFFKNLEIIRDMATREYTDLTTGSAARAAAKEDIVDTGTEYARRFFIPPLTQFGRRMTALDNLIGQRNLRFMGKVLSDEKLFKEYTDLITGRKTLNNFIRTLNSYESIYLNDIANTLEYYDTEEKRVKSDDEVSKVPNLNPLMNEAFLPVFRNL